MNPSPPLLRIVPGFEDFEARDFDVNGTRIHARVARGDDDRPALLLLHGFPQTHAIWHKVAPALVKRYRVVCPDLRGYGDSAKPAGDADHANYSKRTMAADMADLMRALGHDRFHLVGHDRGGRVAHRLALDHPDRVTKLCVIDISPTLTMYDRTDFAFAQAVPPAAVSSAGTLVRDMRNSLCPPLIRFVAMGLPMMPRPMNPIFAIFVSLPLSRKSF